MGQQKSELDTRAQLGMKQKKMVGFKSNATPEQVITFFQTSRMYKQSEMQFYKVIQQMTTQGQPPDSLEWFTSVNGSGSAAA